MNLTNHFWFFKKALSPRLCDDIIRYGLSKKEEIGIAGDVTRDDEEKVLNMQKTERNSNVAWLNDHWIYKEIIPFIQEANVSAGWNYELCKAEDIQFTKYKIDQYYDWHCDSFEKPFNNPESSYHGMVRKVSVTCQLTDNLEYEGGELQFDTRSYNPEKRDEGKHIISTKELLSKGSIVVFPSFVWHRVKPIKKGTRYSLVLWNLGYPFK
jgi:PKHD-type hydroxylase